MSFKSPSSRENPWAAFDYVFTAVMWAVAALCCIIITIQVVNYHTPVKPDAGQDHEHHPH